MARQTTAQISAPQFGAVDVERFSRNLARLVEEGGRALAAYLKPREQGRVTDEVAEELGEIVKTLGHVAEYWLTDPQRTVELQHRLGKAYLELWAAASRRLAGEPGAAFVAPLAGDKRFSDPEWTSNQFFDFLKQVYLLTSQWADKLVADAANLDPHTRQKAEFYVRQITNAIAPTNFVLTNPELLRETFASGAENLVRGMRMLAEDIEAGDGELKIRQSDGSKFEVGRNLAVTPGKVIFQNEMMQLIQYTPTTETVLKRPLLIVPPWINKFYVLDLTPEKSFIKWCVDQGITVFCISWVNPDAHLAQKTFEDYVRQGPLAALDAIKEATGEDKVHAIGYCVGGTLLAVTLAAMAAWRDERIVSATLFAAQVDFTYAGDLKVFVDEEQVAAIEKKMAERGFLDSGAMASVFNMLRSNDLVWPYVINNYLKGKAPFPFDLSVLEFGRHAAAGRQSFVLSAQLLSRQQAVEGQDGAGQYADRSQSGDGADLQSGNARGSHRAGKVGDGRLEIVRRRRALCRVRLRPYRRRGQSARQEEIPVLDRAEAAHRRHQRLARQGQGASGLVVARLALVDHAAKPDRSAGARTGLRRPQGDRGCAGKLREGPRLRYSPAARFPSTETAPPVRGRSPPDSRASRSCSAPPGPTRPWSDCRARSRRWRGRGCGRRRRR